MPGRPLRGCCLSSFSECFSDYDWSHPTSGPSQPLPALPTSAAASLPMTTVASSISRSRITLPDELCGYCLPSNSPRAKRGHCLDHQHWDPLVSQFLESCLNYVICRAQCMIYIPFLLIRAMMASRGRI